MNTTKQLKVVSFGEVLWDVFPDGKKIGGAPLNLALRIKSLGCDTAIISSIGNDTNGDEIIKHLHEQGLDTSGLICTDGYPTGIVTVFLDEHRTASYDINYPAAWDKIVLNEAVDTIIKNADILIYGSLASRDEVSRRSLQHLLKNDIYKVFDVNLRKPHYTLQTITTLMDEASFIKFNDEELLEIAAAMGFSSTSLEDNMKFIANETATASICVTRGKDGALLMWQGKIYNNNGYTVKVADTVGAGDSFLATLIMGLLTNVAPQKALDRACAVGALVAASPGANPLITEEAIENLVAV